MKERKHLERQKHGSSLSDDYDIDDDDNDDGEDLKDEDEDLVVLVSVPDAP